LWHVPILWFAFQRLAAQPVALQVTVFAVLMVTAPVALYRFVEAPLIHVGAALAQRSVAPKLAPSH
jgi:peptidoglycan/LPS O-acetylase OafA/YrhL